jgi:indolepyruvate ferredoxin oxidoreductase
MSAPVATSPVSLDDKYRNESGSVLISGLQALVRLTLDQRRLDISRDLSTAVYVSGYQGSPLGGLDREFGRAAEYTSALDVVFQPGLNEELAATAVAGTQLIGELERRTKEGIVGFWFGKNPGLDRAADAIRHGNVSGTAALGGAVALIGDDPDCKSSTIPSSSEQMCRSLVMPVLAPGTVEDILRLGLHAIALSRDAGLWSAIKVVADVADASATVSLDRLFDDVPSPTPREHRPPILLPPTSLAAEAELLGVRLERAISYGTRAGLNRIDFEPRRPRRALVAAGLAYEAVHRALLELGLGEPELEQLGLRLVKLSMPWPLDPVFVGEFAAGIEEVVVVEDKTPFLSGQIKEALYGAAAGPRILGRAAPGSEGLFSHAGAAQVDDVITALGTWLPELSEDAKARADAAAALRMPEEAPPARIPYFCSGCPHNRSTKASADELVGVGIGCHTLVELDTGGRGRLLGMTQMGGEGSQWLGLAPFTGDHHFTQNMGDGTFHHSGSLAIRSAVAARVRMTYKLLYNDAVAMTGGQHPQGQRSVPALTRLFAAEGVAQVAVVTADPGSYRGVSLDPIAKVAHRDQLAEVEAALHRVDGVTVLIYDDRCATEERRLRKRKQLPTPTQRVWINERVCEGCGDCGEKSTCLSVQPVETEYGRKTRIHQASCNQDYSCLDGDCPSFVVVEPGKRAEVSLRSAPADLPDPIRGEERRDVLLRMPGIGGTGVVTVSQILQMAAHLEGLEAAGLEQIGLAQKGGPVISDVRIGPGASAGSLRANRGAADVLIGFDLLGAASPANLAVADPERTVAIISTSAVPTATMVTDVSAPVVTEALLRRRIDAATRSEENVYLDAVDLSTRLFGDHLPANLLLIGAAYQVGSVPVTAASIESAITLNGTAVETNIEAFRWGRAVIARPAAVEAIPTLERARPPLHPEAASLVEGLPFGDPLAELVAQRSSDLIDYQDTRWARSYVDAVADAADRIGRALGDGGEPLAIGYARGLHKLMAYKDEYEVARLHLDGIERARLTHEFGEGTRVKIKLHPPVLRAMGLKRKVGFGRTAVPLLTALRSAKVLRGRPWDPFGHARVRKVERTLIGEYRELVDSALAHLRPENAHVLTELVALPDVVRGYEEIKLANVEQFRRRAAELSAELVPGIQVLRRGANDV